jgi:hypothetical protein
MFQRRPTPHAATLTLHAGALLVDADPETNAPGDLIAVYGDDERIGQAVLRRLAGRPTRLVATVPMGAAPLLRFPVRLRAQNGQTLREIGDGLDLADADELLRAAGPPAGHARLAGLSHTGATFAVTLDRLPAYARPMVLQAGGAEAHGVSVPGGDGTHAVSFALPAPLAAGKRLVLADAATQSTILDTVMAEADLLDGAMMAVAALERRVAQLERGQAALRGGVERATSIGVERLLLDRLDLFYLLLSDRLDRTLRGADPPPLLQANTGEARSWHYAPGEIEGVGVYALETNGQHDWRWFGPAATVVFRDVPGPVERIALGFEGFGPNVTDAQIGVSVGVVPVSASLSPGHGDGMVLVVPVPKGARFADGTVILHLTFGHYHTTELDRRLLSAVFSGAELFAAA